MFTRRPAVRGLMKRTWLPALALLAVPTIAFAQTTASEAPARLALPPPPPGAAPDGTPPPGPPPPAYTPPTSTYVAAAPQSAGLTGYPSYAQQYPGSSAYAQPYSPAYPPAGFPMVRRRIVPYQGGPIPQGATLETHRPMSFVITGAAVFGGLYFLSILSATGTSPLISCTIASCGAQWLYAPLFGPFVTMSIGTHPIGDQIILAIDGIFQTAGLATFFIAMLHSQEVLVFTDYARNEIHRTRSPQWLITPGAPGTPAGATFSLLQF